MGILRLIHRLENGKPILDVFELINGQLMLIPHIGNAISNEKLEKVVYWINEKILYMLIFYIYFT